ncbi:hypothetical protein LTR84_004823 [Exophiala bonariae]|uniref:Enoyl reductase (ER) domain-containing protein n=1 Tax=Exophiala bonariae TaxID=1690606 RepID=A0AAV9NN02_9EURO|nr:hypothetical protein LTR84_004823 [Exophiala bonariae]
MSQQRATAYVVHKYGTAFALEEVILGALASDQVRVKLKATGICHTDLLAANGGIPVELPAILGHEGVGQITEVGSAVTLLKKDDHVILSFASCATCAKCLSGHPNHCHSFVPLNLTGIRTAESSRTILELTSSEQSALTDLTTLFFGQSSLSSYANVNQRSCVPFDPAVLQRSGGQPIPLSHLAPFACGFMTGAGTVINSCKPNLGSSIAIYGAGAVGIAAIAAAAHLTCANTIIAVDINPDKLALAAKAGATLTINSREGEELHNRLIQDATQGNGPDFVIDTTGNVRVIQQMLSSMSRTGTAIQLAGPSTGPNVQLHPSFMVNNAATYKGVIEGDANPALTIPALVDHYRRGRFPIGDLITEYPHKDLDRAIADIHSGKTVKAVLVWND